MTDNMNRRVYRAPNNNPELGVLVEELNDVLYLMNEDLMEETRTVVESTRTMDKSDSNYSDNMRFLRSVAALPLGKKSPDLPELGDVLETLNASHYGMADAKENIIESLAIAKLSGVENGLSRSLLVSEPGCGKTSFCMALGRAVRRPVVRISFSGVDDVEKMCAGFMRTFKGSTYGRIVDGLIKSKCMDPIFILDEIDKCTNAGALLPLLDGQNGTFHDKYLNGSVDLSKCTFIATANSYHDIDSALRDRLETIFLDGYTTDEKITIMHDYILPSALKKAGMTKSQVVVRKDAMRYMVKAYETSAGCRRLEQMAVKLVRKAAVELLTGSKKRYTLTLNKVEDVFGKPHDRGEVYVAPGVGACTGLCYMNEYMGGTLPFTVIKDRAHTGVKVISNASKVMEESFEIASTHIRNNAELYGLDSDCMDNLGVTGGFLGQGAVPKDGPSAGVLFGLSLISLLKGEPIRERVAMTGEVSLNGSVSAIGGVAQKVRAAAMADYHYVILPLDNAEDFINTVDEDVQACIEPVFVSTLTEAVEFAFNKDDDEDDEVIR